MNLDFRFAIASDLHIALPQTIWDHKGRFHLVEVGIPALETVLEHLQQLDLDFLLLPGDLTQHGEPENHAWLQKRLSQLPFPVYVIPGNHDIPTLAANQQSIAAADFAHYYRQFGYWETEQLYYTCPLLPGVRLIGLNSNGFDNQEQVGRLDIQQLQWLESVLAQAQDELVLVMVHHNVVEHLPDQAHHPLASRYMLENAPELLKILGKYGVKLVFTGHLHIQDIACSQGLYDITTGSLVSYPHPYRVLQYRSGVEHHTLEISSHRVESVTDFPQLQDFSRQWMGERSLPFLLKLLTLPPLNLPLAQAEVFAPQIRDFWAKMANGDALFDFPQFPPSVQHFFEQCSAKDAYGTPRLIDNHATLLL